MTYSKFDLRKRSSCDAENTFESRRASSRHKAVLRMMGQSGRNINNDDMKHDARAVE
jgi:hypothetical protein